MKIDKMKEPLLVIMAAGMGSRFGGLKQITPVDKNGHIIIDYSMFDAYKAGFRKTVFIIKKEIEKDFREVIGNRMEKYFEVRYAFQEVDNLPDGYIVPDGRMKPWGTGHAIACAKEQIDGPFAVINADDYYGADAFKSIYDFLSCERKSNEYAMVGYELKNTVTENGYVSRGVCEVENGFLSSVTERTHIEKRGDNAVFTEDGEHYFDLDGNTIVSMNLWGFQKSFISVLQKGFKNFLNNEMPNNPLKCEFYLPFQANDQLQKGECSIRVLTTSDMWYGMTYAEDLKQVEDALNNKTENGIYPKTLWQTPTEVYQFKLDGAPMNVERYGCGHINTTYLVVTDKQKRYILQRISDAFDVDILMKNISSVLKFTSEHISDERGSMKLVKTLDDKDFYKGENGNFRVYEFVEGSVCLQSAETKQDFYECAVAFGKFQKLLADFPAETLGEPLKNFHNTIDRYRIFKEAVKNDLMGRAKDVKEEIEFALAHEEDGSILQKMRESGELPIRVTHNDTKLNNVLLDEKTHKALCVIDLDTVMPGLAAYDFGDSIRFGAATAAEDEKDLSRMTIDLELYKTFAKGFTESCKLTEKEIETLPLGAKIMTLECGVRFLTDYLNGDIYFTTHYEGQNLDRCRTQFKLVTEMEDKFEDMKLN